jgi:hypothetical protein
VRVTERAAAGASATGFGKHVAHNPSEKPWIHSSFTRNPSVRNPRGTANRNVTLLLGYAAEGIR